MDDRAVSSWRKRKRKRGREREKEMLTAMIVL
jgi:hypothetical protein